MHSLQRYHPVRTFSGSFLLSSLHSRATNPILKSHPPFLQKIFSSKNHSKTLRHLIAVRIQDPHSTSSQKAMLPLLILGTAIGYKASENKCWAEEGQKKPLDHDDPEQVILKIQNDVTNLNALMSASLSSEKTQTMNRLIKGVKENLDILLQQISEDSIDEARIEQACVGLIAAIDCREPTIHAYGLKQLYHVLSRYGNNISFEILLLLESKLRKHIKKDPLSPAEEELQQVYKFLLELILVNLNIDPSKKSALKSDPDFLSTLKPLSSTSELGGIIFLIFFLLNLGKRRDDDHNGGKPPRGGGGGDGAAATPAVKRQKTANPVRDNAQNDEKHIHDKEENRKKEEFAKELIAFKEYLYKGIVDRNKLAKLVELANSEKNEKLLREMLDDIARVIESKDYNNELKQYALDMIVLLSQKTLPESVRNRIQQLLIFLRANEAFSLQIDALLKVHFNFSNPFEKESGVAQPKKTSKRKPSAPYNPLNPTLLISPEFVERGFNLTKGPKIFVVQGGDDISHLSKDFTKPRGDKLIQLRSLKDFERSILNKLAKELGEPELTLLPTLEKYGKIQDLLSNQRGLTLELKGFNSSEGELGALKQLFKLCPELRVLITDPSGDLKALTSQFNCTVNSAPSFKKPIARAKPMDH